MSTLSNHRSNLVKSHELVERLEGLLRDCDVADVPFRHRRASRSWVAERIGCSPGTLTTSVRLRKTLTLWEKSLPNAVTDTTEPELVADVDDSSVVLFPGPKLKDLILPVSVTIKGGLYRMPVLLMGDRVDEWVSSYVRHLRVIKKRTYSTAEQTTTKLRLFRQYQRLHRVKTEEVTDDFLLAWQHSMKAAGVGLNRRNDCLSTVVSFFKWAEERGHLKYHVQLRAKGDYRDIAEDYVFPISARETFVTRKGVTISSWVSTLIEPGGHSTFGTRDTPTFPQIEKIVLAAAGHKRNSTRNILLLDWALQTGARVSEIVQVKIDDLPNDSTIGEYIDRDEEFIVIIVDRKNKGKDSLRVPLDLVLATIDYLSNDADRKRIIASKQGKANKEHVFLSEKGGVLTTDSVTRICRPFFRAAEIENANIHRLRARFITEIIERCLDDMAATGQSVDMTSDWSETILTMARARMGHSHIMSLRPYLNEIKVRRIQIDGKIVPRDEAERKRSQENLHRQMFERIKHNKTLVELDRLKSTGEKFAAVALMRRMLSEMEAELAA
ncbi:tyrosine-type recombinase/integrase [Rhizobium ruizarguesonis]